jgi:hypothetical protein
LKGSGCVDVVRIEAGVVVEYEITFPAHQAFGNT